MRSTFTQTLLLLSVVAAFHAFACDSAHAQQVRLRGIGLIGFPTDMDTSFSVPRSSFGADTSMLPTEFPSLDAKAQTSFGVGLGAEFLVHRYSSFGVEPRLTFYSIEGDVEVSGTGIDLPIVFRMILPVGEFEFYGSLMLGYSILAYSGDVDETATGLILGGFGGAHWAITDLMGVFAEAGPLLRSVNFDDEFMGIDLEINNSTLRLQVQFGVTATF